MTEMEKHVIASIQKRYGKQLDLETEPAVLLEIIKVYASDLERTHAAPEEYVQVETGAVGGVGEANRPKANTGDMHETAVSGEITNTEIMRELLRIRKDLSSLMKEKS